MEAVLELAQRVVDRAAGGPGNLEVYVDERTVTTVQAGTGGALRHVGHSDVRGVGVRATTGERVGYASTTDLSEPGLGATVERARDNARAGDADPAGARLPPSVSAESVSGLCRPSLTRLPIETKVSLVTTLARRVTSLDPRVRRLDTAQWRDEHRRIAIASTRGLVATYQTAYAELWCDALGDDDHGTATDYGYWWGRDPSTVDVEALAALAVHRTVRLLGPATSIRGIDTVVLDPAVSGLFLDAVGRALTGGALGNRRSPFAGRLGEQVAADIVQLVDDGRCVSAPRSAPFDDEGVQRQRTQLIDFGILVGSLHSTATSHTVDGATSTGNARRATYKALPRAGATALRLAPAAAASRETGEAVYLQQVSGSVAGISTVTGKVSLGGIGYVIRDGEPAGRLSTVPISTTLQTWLTELVSVHDDAEVLPDHPVLAPTIVWQPSSRSQR